MISHGALRIGPMMSGNLLSIVGWYFLPNLITGWLHSFYYSIAIRAGEPKPRPGSRQYLTHRKNIYISVIVLYLLYTIYEADWNICQKSDFYQDLGVSHDVDEKAIQSRFRKLTILYHPDKSNAREGTEGLFVHLKVARDTLVNPAKRFAYDRFGPDVVGWQNCITIYDYVSTGLKHIFPYYVASGLFMLVLGMLGFARRGSYWRYLTICSVFVFELHTVSRPHPPSLISGVINPLFALSKVHPPYLPFQALILARKIAITSFIALSQLSPIFSPSKDDSVVLSKQLARLTDTTKKLDIEAKRLLALELAPFVSKRQYMVDLKLRVREWLVQNRIRGDTEVRSTVSRVLRTRDDTSDLAEESR